MKASLDPFMLATDVADYLVRKGVPFRETHHISGRCVAKSEETGIPMNELSYETLKAIDERFEEDIADVFNYEACAESRTAKAAPARQLFSSRSRSSKRFSVKKGHWALMNEMIRR
ncbi:argininosuccinate lyase C-terminal-domain-containing protein [Dactylonectria macrodidyma]|uniref:Argininosuccinate lyase C-terminal-domain-containing protein n=1 Tax=Dactylonectria macrodidyma TaxID=307937 RepID=A0A9P9ET73_9HYPO|nr:argininosuccinate lyase C-terminal-domain-containing protein [Dactylonectria macrodidyma]